MPEKEWGIQFQIWKSQSWKLLSTKLQLNTMFSNEIEYLFGDVWKWMQNIGGLLFLP